MCVEQFIFGKRNLIEANTINSYYVIEIYFLIFYHIIIITRSNNAITTRKLIN